MFNFAQEQPLPTSKGSKCLSHPDEEAVNKCKSCRRPLCVKCSIVKPEGVFCCDTCWNKVKKFQDRLATIQTKATEFDKREASAKKKTRLIYIVVVLLLIGCCCWLFKAHPDLFDTAIKTVTPYLKKVGIMK